MNVRLVRASQFLSQFNLDVRYKSEKDHVISDALSRLASTNLAVLKSNHFELDALFCYNTTLIEMFDEFCKKMIEGYANDPVWKKVHQTILRNNRLGINAANLSFTIESMPFEIDSYMESRSENEPALITADESTNKKLIYHVNDLTGLRRLCIPSSCVKDILDIAHDEDHPGFARCFEIIFRAWYVKRLIKQLRIYIRHCPQCLVLQIRRHSSYDDLQSIETPSIPFHTITLNFILALSLSTEDWDTIMSVTDKFIKRVTMILGRKNFKVKDWAFRLLERLDTIDWGYLKVIITDRNRKFLSELWKAIFERLNVRLLYSTSYHPQTDEASERTNQTAEIALRYYIHGLEDVSIWPQILSRFQALTNNAVSSSTRKTLNEIAYGFTPNRPLDLLSDIPELKHSNNRIEAKDVISWANMKHKHHYDRRHTPLFLNENDWALIKLHNEYNIPSTLEITKKLTQQYVESFKILQRIDRLAYKLDIPDDWKIHSMFSVAQLEPSPSPQKDPFNRPRPTNPPPVFVEGDTEKSKSYEIDRLLNKRVIKRGRDQSIEYLIRWKDYGSEWDRWYNIKNLEDVDDLIKEYEQAVRPTWTSNEGIWLLFSGGGTVTVLPLPILSLSHHTFLKLILASARAPSWAPARAPSWAPSWAYLRKALSDRLHVYISGLSYIR